MEESLQIYKEWYADAKDDIDGFMDKYQVSIENSEIDEIVSLHGKCCQMVNIEAAPTIYVHGYELPNWYNVEDLKYFIRQ